MIIHPMEYQFPYEKTYNDEYFRIVTEMSVPDIKPQYYISNYGRFYSEFSNRLMKPTVAASKRRTGGYYVNTIQTTHGPETVLNHRVEMIEFRYEPDCEKLTVDHINTNKRDDFIDNLEWVTVSENSKRAAKNGLLLTGEDAPWTTLKDEQVHKICQLRLEGISLTKIANEVGCKLNRVFDVVHGITRRNISSQYNLDYSVSK